MPVDSPNKNDNRTSEPKDESDTCSDSSTPASVPNEFFEVESPYRPYPLGAKKALRDAVETVIFPSDEPRTAYVSSIPETTLLEEWELSVIRHDDPDEVWETRGGDQIEIYSDRVERNGREMSIGSEKAKRKARSQEYFSRIE